jgi:hypothetical protein
MNYVKTTMYNTSCSGSSVALSNLLRPTLILAEVARHCSYLHQPEKIVIDIKATDKCHQLHCTSMVLPSHSNFHVMTLALCPKASTSPGELVLLTRPVMRTVVPSRNQT